ncbi:hypothetical protein ACO2I3_14795 [Leptospira interrogans]
MVPMIRADDHLSIAERPPHSGRALAAALWLFVALALHWAIPVGPTFEASLQAQSSSGANGASQRADEPALQPRALPLVLTAESHLLSGKRDPWSGDSSFYGLPPTATWRPEPRAVVYTAAISAEHLPVLRRTFNARGPPRLA